MIRIVVTGSECTGKTTLAEDLSRRLAVPWLPEFAREYVAALGGLPTAADVEPIARGQIAAEDRAHGLVPAGLSIDRPLLILDTDLLSTVVYSHHYYGRCPGWVEQELRRRAGDLYLLADIDVPWVADGPLRDRGDRREEMQALFRRALIDRSLSFEAITGSPTTRLAAAIAAIEARLSALSC